MKKHDAQEAVKEARRAYYRQWAKKNPEKVKAAQQRFYEKLARQAQEAKS